MEIFDCLFDYLQAENNIEAVKKKKKKKKKNLSLKKKKKKKKKRQIIILHGPIDNDIDKIKTEDSI